MTVLGIFFDDWVDAVCSKMSFVHPTVCLLQKWQTLEATFALDVSFLTAVVSGCSQGPVILHIIFRSKISRWFNRSHESHEVLLWSDCIVGNARCSFKQVDVNVKMCNYIIVLAFVACNSPFVDTLYSLYTHDNYDSAYSASYKSYMFSA